MTKGFLGSGWAFPVAPADGALKVAAGEDSIEQSIRIILETAKGERQMRPDFGCGLHELVFGVLNKATAGMAAYHVEQALRRWEPRIELLRVSAQPDWEVATARLLIDIEYRIVETNSVRNIVYPFYLTEGASP